MRLQVLEVNGIDVNGKTLDQVTDMMVANAHNLIITGQILYIFSLEVHSFSETSQPKKYFGP